MTLKVVDPIDITEAVLTASDIPEPDASVGEVEWQDPTELDQFGSYSNVQETATGAPNGIVYSFGWSGLISKIDINNKTVSEFSGYSGIIRTSEMALDGCIYFTGDSGIVYKLDPIDDSVVTIGSFSGSCGAMSLAPDGNIYGSGDNGFAIKIDTSLQSVSTFGSHSNQSYKTSSLGGDGNVYCAGIGDVLKINVEEQSVEVFGTYKGRYDGSQAGSDGNIYLVGNTGTVLKIDVGGGDISTFGTYFGRYFSAASSDGDVIKCVGSINATGVSEVIDINITTQEVTRYGSYNINALAITEATGGVMIAVGRDIGANNGVIYIPKAYSPGDRVVLESEHLVYQCLSYTYENPKDGATDDSVATWIVVGPTNKWAMFDGLQNTKTTSSTDFTVTINPPYNANTLAMLGFSGVESVRIEVDNSLDVNIYDKTYSMSDFSAIYDHYTYVFYQIASLDDFIATDLPPLPNTTIRVTFSGSNMTIGELVTGFAIDIGQLVAENTKSDRFRYREQEYNEFGYPTGEAPIVVELNTYDVLVPKLNNQAIQKLLDTLTGENTLWVGDIGGGQSLVTYGFFERSPIPYSMPNHINYQITVRASV